MNSLLSWATGGSRSVVEEVEDETTSGDEFSESADSASAEDDLDDDEHDEQPREGVLARHDAMEEVSSAAVETPTHTPAHPPSHTRWGLDMFLRQLSAHCTET